MGTLDNFFQKSVDLPDGNRVVVSAVKPVSNSDDFIIEPPIEDTAGASVIGFVESSTGSTTAVKNFYVGTSDHIRISNRAGQNVTVVSLSKGRANYVSRRAS